MVDSIINTTDTKKADAIILGVPYDGGASYGEGSDKGPQAVKECLDTQIELFDRFLRREVCYDFLIAYKELEHVREMTSEQMVQHVKGACDVLNGFPLLLGGSHSVSIGAFQSLAEKVDPRTVTIVQIDAHLDIRDDDSEYNDVSPSKYAHSCVMRRAVDFGFPTVHMGVRTYAREEYEFIKERNIPVFEWDRDTLPRMQNILDAIQTNKVYLTFDIDGLDPAHTPGTGAPVPGGISWTYITRFLRLLCKEKDLVGADIVEIAPGEGDILTPYASAQICYTILSYVLSRRRDQRLYFLE